LIKRTFNITARIEQGQPPFCFQCVQGDKDAYALHIRITEGDKEINYNEVSNATITFALSNGAVVQSDPARLTVSSTGITYQMGTSEISCPGKVLASIQLFGSSGERLTTARFQFEVIADLITENAVKSTNEFPILQRLKEELEAIDVVDLTNQFNAHKAESVTNGNPHGIRSIANRFIFESTSGDSEKRTSSFTLSSYNHYLVYLQKNVLGKMPGLYLITTFALPNYVINEIAKASDISDVGVDSSGHLTFNASIGIVDIKVLRL